MGRRGVSAQRALGDPRDSRSRGGCCSPSVGRDSPRLRRALRRAFGPRVSRKPRQSDGTVTVEGCASKSQRPTAHTLATTAPAVARWDLASIRSGRPPLGRAPRDDLAAPRQGAKRRTHSARRHPCSRPDRRRAPSRHRPHLRRLMARLRRHGDSRLRGGASLTPTRRGLREQTALPVRIEVLILSAPTFRPKPLFTTPAVRQLRPTHRARHRRRRLRHAHWRSRHRQEASPYDCSPSAFAHSPMSSSAPSPTASSEPHDGLLPRELEISSPCPSPRTIRWAGFKALRTRWADRAIPARVAVVPCSSSTKPRKRSPPSSASCASLASKELDSKQLLCVVFAGDARLPGRLRSRELLPLGSRIRRRLTLLHASRDELLYMLDHLLAAAEETPRS